MKGPEPNSNRTRKRTSRGWESLEKSSRKHRRANKRLAIGCTIGGQKYKPGDVVQPGGEKFQYKASGSLKYHSS